MVCAILHFRVFNMKGNNLKAPLLHNEMFNDFQFTLLKLDLSGDKNAPTNLQEVRRYVIHEPNLVMCGFY